MRCDGIHDIDACEWCGQSIRRKHAKLWMLDWLIQFGLRHDRNYS